MFNPEFLATENNDPNYENDLIQYLQKQSPDVLQRVAKSASEDIQEIISIMFKAFLDCFLQINLM